MKLKANIVRLVMAGMGSLSLIVILPPSPSLSPFPGLVPNLRSPGQAAPAFGTALGGRRGEGRRAPLFLINSYTTDRGEQIDYH